MKALSLFFALCLSLTALQAQSQLPFNHKAEEFYEIYTVVNPNGSRETMHLGQKNVVYFSSKFPQGVKLIIQGGKTASDMGEEDQAIWVNFPNNTKRYKLYMGCAPLGCPLHCLNPDGKVQAFEPKTSVGGWQGLFECRNPNGLIEYMYLENDQDLKYRNSKQNSYTKLRISKLEKSDMGVFRACEARFPNSEKVYKIKAEYDTKRQQYYLTCLNPDGSLQKFYWLNK